MPRTKKVTTGEQATDAADAAGGASAGGAAAGLVAGAALGAVAGGPVGAAIGAAIGGPVGAALGRVANFSDHEHEFKSMYESGPYKAITPWKDASTAYKYGFEGFDQAGGKSYDQVVTHLRSSYKGKGKFEDVEPMVKAAYNHRLSAHGAGANLTAGKTKISSSGTATEGTIARASEQVVPFIEEELKVGKRTVDKGGVKVKTTVTETPVEEDVHLHEERVVVERRPTNRKVTTADAAYKEGTIEFRETAEEAVVAKIARVVEEVVIKRQGRDKTHKVRDSAKQTDVEVSETAGTGAASATTFETFEPTYRKDFQTRLGKTGMTFESHAPAYKYGHSLVGDERFHGEWTQVEPEARKHWEAKNAGTWTEYKDSVHHAWEHAKGR